VLTCVVLGTRLVTYLWGGGVGPSLAGGWHGNVAGTAFLALLCLTSGFYAVDSLRGQPWTWLAVMLVWSAHYVLTAGCHTLWGFRGTRVTSALERNWLWRLRNWLYAYPLLAVYLSMPALHSTTWDALHAAWRDLAGRRMY